MHDVSKREPSTATEEREALHCNPDPDLCGCNGTGSYDTGIEWHSCPWHDERFPITYSCGNPIAPEPDPLAIKCAELLATPWAELDGYQRHVQRLLRRTQTVAATSKGHLRVVAMKLGIGKLTEECVFELDGEPISFPGKRMTRANDRKLRDRIEQVVTDHGVP